MKLSKLAKEILGRQREAAINGQRVAVDGGREIAVALSLEKHGHGRFVSERSETRHAGDYRTINRGGHFYPTG